MTIYFKNIQDLSSVSTSIYTMIQTNLPFVNTIWKHIIIKNLYYLFQNVSSQRVKYPKNTPQTFQTVLSFYNNTRCNKINQMPELKMDWYSLISIHKPASRAMLSECLMTLDHLSREVEQRIFETMSQQGFDCNFKASNAGY